VLMPATMAKRHGKYMKHFAKTGTRRLIGKPRKLTCVDANGDSMELEISLGIVDRSVSSVVSAGKEKAAESGDGATSSSRSPRASEEMRFLASFREVGKEVEDIVFQASVHDCIEKVCSRRTMFQFEWCVYVCVRVRAILLVMRMCSVDCSLSLSLSLELSLS
jgi:hypothetical protein